MIKQLVVPGLETRRIALEEYPDAKTAWLKFSQSCVWERQGVTDIARIFLNVNPHLLSS